MEQDLEEAYLAHLVIEVGMSSIQQDFERYRKYRDSYFFQAAQDVWKRRCLYAEELGRDELIDKQRYIFFIFNSSASSF